MSAATSTSGCTAAILCGGRGRRMGGMRKPLLETAGQSILARQLAVLTPLFAEVVLLADEAAPFARLGRRVLLDAEPGRGPLPAIAAALRTLAAPALFVVAGDMPYLAAEAVSLTVEHALADGVDLAAPWVGGHPEPLHACYRPTCLPAMERALVAGRLSVAAVYPEVRVARIAEAVLRRIDPTLAFLRGVNVPGDLA
ncbi:MAG: molybdenum cofactor guanylyltransferase [Deltaproteobacteria bacterium]|nr:molybdenum cofactor guanylyltransferase [Deltaproteobacteria bacterium]